MGYRNDDEAMRARLDAVLAENAELREELAKQNDENAAGVAGTDAQTAQKQAPRPVLPAERAAPPTVKTPTKTRKSWGIWVPLLTLVTLPGAVCSYFAIAQNFPKGPAIVLDGVALFAIALVVYGKTAESEA